MAITPVLKIVTPDAGSEYALVQDLLALADTVEKAILAPPRVRLTSTTELSLTSVNHAFQIGASDDYNLAADMNEIQARFNNGASSLFLNPAGGNVQLGSDASTVIVPGKFEEGGYVLTTSDNLNSVVRGGRYLASTNTAAFSRNYPVERSGMLEVVSSAWAGASDGLRIQRYTSNAIPMSWLRWWSASNGWSTWTNITPLTGTYDFNNMVQGTTRTATVTFPSGAFRSGPAVVLGLGTTVPQNCDIGVSSISATGFTINARRSDNTENLRVHWTAM